MTTNEEEVLQDWEKELLADHRWGRFKIWFPEDEFDNERVSHEHRTLKELWKKAGPLNEPCKDILHSIMNLEICNWNLEESIISLCQAIVAGISPELDIGHSDSITDDRWRIVWAYYLTLKTWLPHSCSGRSSGYGTLLRMCDRDGTIQSHVVSMLGGRTELKELYVERFCLNLEYWLGGFYRERSPQLYAYEAAVKKLERKILALDPGSEILQWMKLDGKKGWIEICHHKTFRRFDIHISSIGAGTWRGHMHVRGTDGLERASTIERYLYPIEAWVTDSPADGAPDTLLFEEIHTLLGEKDGPKEFLASLLVSLLRSQQLAAKQRAEKRSNRAGAYEKKNNCLNKIKEELPKILVRSSTSFRTHTGTPKKGAKPL